MKTVLDVGDFAPDFSLIGHDGLIYTLNQYKGYRAIVLFFTSEECPYAKGIDNYLQTLAKDYYKRGVAFVAIHSGNEPQIGGKPWVSLHDPTQKIAKRYGAKVTPHFFLFDHQRMLIYSGRALDNPKAPQKSAREDLKESLTELLDLKPISVSETEPIGCAIPYAFAESEDLALV